MSGGIGSEGGYDIASSRAPTNIAIIKYWGKDEARGGNTPINSSCSLTLDPNDLRAETVVIASQKFQEDELILNGKKASVADESTHAKRLRSCLETMRKKCIELPESSNASSVEELQSWKVRIVSQNTFPTAAGLASSAAGYAALVKALAVLYNIKETFEGELSTIARQGSGSASRSLYGGLVAWEKGIRLDDSRAVPFFDENHWPELRVIVLVANADEKETPSTQGMQLSVKTSPFLLHRADAVAEPRISQLKDAYARRDFAAFAKLCMRDSNSFHATCLDTFPPIFYMNHTSRAIIRAVHAFNASLKQNGPGVAYTFDAGPNAVCFCRDQKHADAFLALAFRLFSSQDCKLPCNKPLHLQDALKMNPPPSAKLLDDCGGIHYLGAKLKMIYLTKLGPGASSPLPSEALSTLIDHATLEPRLLTEVRPFSLIQTLSSYALPTAPSSLTTRQSTLLAFTLGHILGLATFALLRPPRH